MIFIAIASPTGYLLWRSYQHLWAEARFAYKENAYLLLQLINRRMYNDLEVEEKRSYSEYRFIKAVRVIGGEEVTLTELARYPVQSQWAGMVGYFQLDPDGSVRTPVLPDGLLDRLPIRDRIGREALRDTLRAILDRLQVRHGNVMRRVSARALEVDVLADSIKAGDGLALKGSAFRKRFEKASEKEAIVFDVESEAVLEGVRNARPIRRPNQNEEGILDVEIDPFQARFDAYSVAFFRNVWRNEERFIQGFVVDLRTWLGTTVSRDLGVGGGDPAMTVEFLRGDTLLARFGDSVAYDGAILVTSPLQSPLADMSFQVRVAQQKQPPGANMVWGLGVVMLAVLAGGLWMLYRLTYTQLSVSAKRQDFISAVSHELKTPLTAIRMYAELLQNAWVASEEKRRRYYGMILGESERLSRLIQNVLSLSALERRRWHSNPQRTNPRLFIEEFAQKFGPTVEHSGFRFDLKLDPCDFEIPVDRDALSQILVNLVDNGIKFAADFEPKILELRLTIRGGDIRVGVRDFGPGVPPSELEYVWSDFYRVENEMTRRTKGTGLGLSLVRQLCQATGMRPRLQNVSPGLLAEIRFPSVWL